MAVKQNKNPIKSRKIPKKASASRARQALRFLPAVAISLFATYLWAQPHVAILATSLGGPDVLAKATNVSHSGLLSATNAQRSANGVAKLSANSRLNSAAQAKAHDMVTKGYWAHVTPDGKQPWWFITAAGYQYTAAGENLAYGFMSSDSTVTGWMNSPSHKENLLSKNFTEVGFGFADTNDYIYNGTSHGPQTVVVAMYGKPQVLSSSAPSSSSKPASEPKLQVKSSPQKAKTETVEKPETEEAKPAEAEEEPQEEEPIATVTNTATPPPVSGGSGNISRIQLLTGGSAVWSASFVAMAVLAGMGLWVFHKGWHLRRYVLAGEHFISRHVHLDLMVLSVIYLGAILLTTSGTIR